MKIDRYDLPVSPWDHTATSDFGNWCRSAQVARFEASHAELLEALRTLTAVVGLTPLAGNKDAMQDAFNIARAAIAKAEGGTP